MEHVFLVVFDLDGVIVNTSSFHYRAWKRLLAEEWGVEHTQEVDDMTKGIGRYECLRLITQQYGIELLVVITDYAGLDAVIVHGLIAWDACAFAYHVDILDDVRITRICFIECFGIEQIEFGQTIEDRKSVV